jgi:hypothetical protein
MVIIEGLLPPPQVWLRNPAVAENGLKAPGGPRFAPVPVMPVTRATAVAPKAATLPVTNSEIRSAKMIS